MIDRRPDLHFPLKIIQFVDIACRKQRVVILRHVKNDNPRGQTSISSGL